MTEIIQSLASLHGRYDALFCVLWGCLHDGKRPFPTAVTALQRFRAAGGKVVLLTNAPRPKASVIRQLDAMAMPRDAWDEVVTSGDAAQYAMLTGAVGRKVYHIGAPKDEPPRRRCLAVVALEDQRRVGAAEPEAVGHDAI